MNIPIALLRRVPSSVFAFHQSLAKKMMKWASKKSKEVEDPSKFRSKVLSWLFNQEPSLRLKLCSMQNKYLIQVLLQMKQKHRKHLGNFHFSIIKEDRGDSNPDDISYTSFFEGNDPEKIKMAKDKHLEAEDQLISEVRFLSLNDYNDIITLSQALLHNEELFKQLFFVISNKQCFAEAIHSYQEEDSKFYNFELPLWIRTKAELTFGEVLLMYFEQVILVNYSHYQHYNELYSFPFYAKIDEVLETNATLMNFILESSNRVALYNSISFNAIRKAIKDDALVCDMLKKFDVPNLFGKNLTLSEQIDDSNMKLRKIYLDTEKFINEITFASFSNVYAAEDFVFKKIWKHFNELHQAKNVNDLLNDEEEEKKKTETKKKKKKKKKKKASEAEAENESVAIAVPSSSNQSRVEDSKESPEANKKEIATEETNSELSEKADEEGEKLPQKKKVLFLFPVNTNSKKKNKKNDMSNTKVIETNQKEESKRKEAIDNSLPSKSQVEMPQSTIKPITKQESTINISPQSNLVFMPKVISTEYTDSDTLSNSNYLSYNPYLSFYTLFNIHLSKEIDDFASNVMYHKQLLNKTRKDTISRLTELIAASLQHDYEIRIDFYGSYATDFSIESSDIDILIHFRPSDPLIEPKTETVLLILAKAFMAEKDFLSKVDPILTASVPVIKLECNILKELDSETTASLRHSYAFTFDEIFTIKFDITFTPMELMQEPPILQVVNYIKQSALVFPQLKKVLFVLKRYLQTQKLNSSYHGGLSSFSLFLLLFAFIKNRKGRFACCGEVLFDFFDFYSKFDFSHYTINVSMDNPYVYYGEIRGSAIEVLDPFTQLNVAKSSFLIQEVKEAFIKALKYFLSFNYNDFGIIDKPIVLVGLFSI